MDAAEQVSLNIRKEVTMDTPSIHKAINKAIFQVYKQFPFWGFIMERCSVSLTKTIQTACVTPLGKMYINPDFILTLSTKQLLFIFAHEIQHLAMNHHARGKNKDHELWNMATDYVINLDITKIFNDLGENDACIPGILYNEAFNGLTSEEVYAKLLTSVPKNTPSSYNKDIIYVEAIPEDAEELREARCGLDQTEINNSSRDWKEIALTAATSTKLYGNLASSIEREILGNMVPKVNWNVILRRYLQDEYSLARKEDFSFSNYNRRQASFSYKIPGSLYTKNKKPIVFVVDTSGSMDDKDIAQALAELRNIQKTFSVAVYLMACDATVHETTWLKPGNWTKPTVSGGGGTNFAPIFTHLVEKKMENSLVLVHTDGFGSFGDKPKNKVLWLLTTNTKTPWGERLLLT